MCCKNCKCKDLTASRIIEQMDDTRKPFVDTKVDKNTRIRNFHPQYEDHLFKWHWDDEDRWIEATGENDWQFQFDDELPQSLEPNKIIMIPKGIYHNSQNRNVCQIQNEDTVSREVLNAELTIKHLLLPSHKMVQQEKLICVTARM